MLKYYLNLSLLLLLCLSSLNSHADDEQEDDGAHTAHQIERLSVQLDAATILVTGIQTETLHNTQFTPDIETFATSVDISPLLEARKEYFKALAKQSVTHITLKKSQVDLQHLKKLNRENVITKRKLLAQKSQVALDQANYQAEKQHVHNIRLQTQAKWGTVLSDQFLNGIPPTANKLKRLNQALYLIYLPPPLNLAPPTLSIHPFGIREQAQTASLISSAAIHSTQLQQMGAAFYYLADENMPAYHPRVVAWLSSDKDQLSGFIIPESALVWHLGQSYLYLQVDDELFKRIKISDKQIISRQRYFIQQGLHEGDHLVITGAQMLLSEEFRGQIPAEDDDDDDD